MKELTAEEKQLVAANMDAFTERIRKAFGEDGIGYIECEYEGCICNKKKMETGRFHVFIAPPPKLEVLAVCKDAINALTKEYNIKAEPLFDPKLN